MNVCFAVNCAHVCHFLLAGLCCKKKTYDGNAALNENNAVMEDLKNNILLESNQLCEKNADLTHSIAQMSEER